MVVSPDVPQCLMLTLDVLIIVNDQMRYAIVQPQQTPWVMLVCTAMTARVLL